MVRTFLFVLALLYAGDSTAQALWGALKPGDYSVGFKLIREYDNSRNGRTMIVSLWYPSNASTPGKPVLFKDYLSAGIITPSLSQPTDTQKESAYEEFRTLLEKPFLFGGAPVSKENFNKALDLPSAAKWNAAEAAGPFPCVLISTEPESLSVTAEFLASNGFVVAAINAPYGNVQPPDSLLWVEPTADLAWLANYTKNLKNVDQSKLACLGFGGGIQSSFFLTMKMEGIRALVNLEGGVFGPRSLTDKSVEYHPEKMRTPMLHIVASFQRNEDDVKQQRALVNTKIYRAHIQHDGLRHHDFSMFGRVYNRGLKMRGNLGDIADQTYVAAHGMILEFLKLFTAGRTAEFVMDDRYMPFISMER